MSLFYYSLLLNHFFQFKFQIFLSAPMFSNFLLNKICVSEQQSQTPQFNRYCQINQQKLIEVARSVIPNDDEINFNKNKQNKHENQNDRQINCKKNNTTNQEIEEQLQRDLNKQLQNNHQQHITTQVDKELNLSQSQQNTRICEEGNEFLQLKEQMLNIQSLATKQIARLKKELAEKEEQIDKLIGIIQTLKERGKISEKNGEMSEIGVSTEDDYKDEEIKSLKEALVRHIRLNKELTKKLGGGKQNLQNNQNFSNLSSSISKLVSNILI